jgi:hypothetical protein
LLELEAGHSETREAQLARYGPDFVYTEFMVTPGILSAVSLTIISITGLLILALVNPV